MPDFDMESRRVIEALRSGVPSRAVGKYFSKARPKIMKEISDDLAEVSGNSGGTSKGMIIRGRYGEGKTHLLNTVFSMAGEKNMAVSYVSIGKETPFDRLYLVYQKLIANTYLPGREQPGFLHLLSELTPNSNQAADLLQFASTQLQTDKLFYLLKAYFNTEDQDEKFLLQADLEGDFISNAILKKTYRRIFQKPAKFNVPFVKSRHMQDYMAFMSHLFRVLGLDGWVILADEAELTGRLGKKARLNTYRNMYRFLEPDKDPATGLTWEEKPEGGSGLENTFTVFAFSSSYEEEVIEGKHDRENMEEVFAEDPQARAVITSVIDRITEAPELSPLTPEEILQTLESIRDLHGKAYDWKPEISAEALKASTDANAALLRTRLRAAIEILDQIYQYGDAAGIEIGGLDQESLDGEDAEESEED